MRALPFRLPTSAEESLQIQIDELERFYDRLHHHPELQLTLIESSHGTRFVGDHIGHFAPGDVTMIGAHVPHRFLNDESEVTDEPRPARSISVYFDAESLGRGLLNLPEMAGVPELLSRASQGLELTGDTRIDVATRIREMVHQDRFERLVSLLVLLRQFAHSSEVMTMASSACISPLADADGSKMADIVNYVMRNYTRAITLDEIAHIAKMSTSAFCRYFKTRTQKTFTDFVNEVRIGSACRMLIGSERTIKEVCYSVGFNNVSHFNRQFRAKTGHTPSAYVQKFGSA